MWLQKCQESFCFVFSSSPDMPENEATFAITPGGVADAKE